MGVAERSSKLAVAFLRIGPKSLGFVSPGIRPALIRWAAILADHSRETLIDFLERSREVLKALTEEEGSFLLSRGLDLASLDPSISHKFFLNLPGSARKFQRTASPPGSKKESPSSPRVFQRPWLFSALNPEGPKTGQPRNHSPCPWKKSPAP